MELEAGYIAFEINVLSIRSVMFAERCKCIIWLCSSVAFASLVLLFCMICAFVLHFFAFSNRILENTRFLQTQINCKKVAY